MMPDASALANAGRGHGAGEAVPWVDAARDVFPQANGDDRQGTQQQRQRRGKVGIARCSRNGQDDQVGDKHVEPAEARRRDVRDLLHTLKSPSCPNQRANGDRHQPGGKYRVQLQPPLVEHHVTGWVLDPGPGFRARISNISG